MSESVERAVAAFLGEAEVNWERLKPVMSFVVLWNRLEVKHGQHLTLASLEGSADSATRSPTFDISRYKPARRLLPTAIREFSATSFRSPQNRTRTRRQAEGGRFGCG